MFLHVPVSYIHAGSELRQRALTTLEKKIEVRMLSLPVPYLVSAGHSLAGSEADTLFLRRVCLISEGLPTCSALRSSVRLIPFPSSYSHPGGETSSHIGAALRRL